MKVLHISYNDWGAAGGTSVSVCRMHWALRKRGVDSRILCRVRRLDSEYSVTIPRSRVLEYAIRQFTSRLGLNDLEGVSSFGIRKHPLYKQADVVHLHSMHSGYFNYLALRSEE